MINKQLALCVGIGAILITASILAGCKTTLQTYPGPALPESQDAELDIGTSDLYLLRCDGNSCGTTFAGAGFHGTLRLLPGQHSLRFVFYAHNAWTEWNGAGITQAVDFEAGKRYKAAATVYRGNAPNSMSWSVAVTEEE
jgi:hypothetical protein